MAARALHVIDTQMALECNKGIEWEDGMGCLAGHGVTECLRSPLKAKIFRDRFSQEDSDVGWLHIVENYSRRKLTRDSDKLHALAGLAKRAQPSPADVYLAGLWKNSLASQLLWEPAFRRDVDSEYHAGMKTPQQSRAPSWTWAALGGPVQFAYRRPRDLQTDNLAIRVLQPGDKGHPGTLFAALSVKSDLMAIPEASIADEKDEFDGSRAFIGKVGTAASRGEARFDTGEVPSVSQFWLLRFLTRGVHEVNRPHGLILQALETRADTYCRVGIFRLLTSSEDGESWFPECSAKTITIV
jgi:hypothetical protein